jgi:hypothetical protein
MVRVIFQAVFRPVSFDERKATVAAHFLMAVKSRRQGAWISAEQLLAPADSRDGGPAHMCGG